MKIHDILLTNVKIPLIPLSEGGIAPYRGHNLARGTGLTHAVSCIFKVITDDGIIGWGETNPIINLKVQRALFEVYIKPLMLGKDPHEINLLSQQVTKAFEPPLATKSMLAGIDVACWDILGKAAGQPIYNLLGGMVRNKAGIAYCLGLEEFNTTKEKLIQIKEQGYKTLKTKGGEDVAYDIKRAEFLRNCVGSDFNLRIDMNQAYDISQAVRYLAGVEKLDLEYIEQPIAINQFDALASLRKRSKTPIAINEDSYIRHNLFECIRRNAIDIAVVDLDPSGGISELVRVANICLEAGLPLAHHCGFDMGIKLAAILQIYAAKPAFSHPTDSTYMAHSNDLLTEKIKIMDGSYMVPEGPGLGIEVDEDKLKFYRVDE